MERLRDGLKPFLPNVRHLPSPRQLLQAPLLAPLVSHHNSPVQVSFTEPSCNLPALSCPSEPQLPVDTCCMNYPAGHYLMTQFWDTSPPLGPDHSWTIHGLWPDYCNGGFPAFCDQSRSKSPEELTAILSEAAKSSHPDILKTMTHYWLSNDHRNSNLWSHEWNKHGTCISTLEPQCYADSYSTTDSTNEAILDYFTHTTNLFSTLDTHALFKEHDILPSTSRTYSLAELESAIQSSKHAQTVTLRCNSRHELDEIWYHFIINGPLRNASASASASPSSSHFSLQDNNEALQNIFIPVPPDGQLSNCPASGIKYLPKKSSGSPSQTVSSPGASPPTSTSSSAPHAKPFSGKGHLKIHILPSSDSEFHPKSNSDSKPIDFDLDLGLDSTSTPQVGCLIRSGKWYSSGTCATYTAAADIQPQKNHQEQPHSSHPSPNHDTAKVKGEEKEEPTPIFTLQSSYAPCAILLSSSHHGEKGEFVCDKTLPIQSIFSAGNSTLVPEDGGDEGERVLVYRNQTVFYAERVPGRFEKVGLFADDGEGKRSVRVEVHWEGI